MRRSSTNTKEGREASTKQFTDAGPPARKKRTRLATRGGDTRPPGGNGENGRWGERDPCKLSQEKDEVWSWKKKDWRFNCGHKGKKSGIKGGQAAKGPPRRKGEGAEGG